jgi:NAD-dependent deacetylase
LCFFGEPIPENAARLAYDVAKKSDVHIIVGTTGEVQPASYIPVYAKKAGALIIEITPNHRDLLIRLPIFTSR